MSTTEIYVYEEKPRKYRLAKGYVICTLCWENDKIRKRPEYTIEFLSSTPSLYLCQDHLDSFKTNEKFNKILGIKE